MFCVKRSFLHRLFPVVLDEIYAGGHFSMKTGKALIYITKA